MIHVLVAGEVRLVRDGLAMLLQQVNDGRLRLAVVAAGDDLARRAQAADVIVLHAPARNCPDSIYAIAAAARKPMVAVGVGNDEAELVALAELGVLGFAGRDASVDELVESIENAARGEATCPPRIATTLLRRVTHVARTGPPNVSPLTVREREIVELIGEGLSNKEIAARLYIEVATVKNHVHNILEKLQVSRRTEAVARLRLVEGGQASVPAASGFSSRFSAGWIPGSGARTPLT